MTDPIKMLKVRYRKLFKSTADQRNFLKSKVDGGISRRKYELAITVLEYPLEITVPLLTIHYTGLYTISSIIKLHCDVLPPSYVEMLSCD